ncbi:MAG: phosphatidate cytidylyltransferase [Candidatus Tectomicrobia bacterium]
MEQSRRILSAVVVLPPLVLFLAYASLELFLLLVCSMMGMGLYEYFRLMPFKQSPVCVGMSYAIAFSLALSAYLGGMLWMPLTLSLSIMALTMSVIVTAGPSSPPFPMLLHSLFGIILIGWGLSHLILLRSFAGGKWYILLLCVVIWVGDASAMYIGQSLGRHHMAPTISPGKTWEGAVGGVLSCLLAAALGSHILVPDLSLRQSLVFGLLISLAAQLSDLGESMLKRYAGVKDSGALIPGHGGVLDRIDSLFFAAPLAFYMLNFLTILSAP